MIVIISAALIAILGTVRWYLFHHGVLYGGTAAHDSDIIFAALLALILFAALRRVVTENVKSGAVFATAGSVLALAVSAFATVQLILPNSPTSAAAAACRGVPVQGAAFFGQTPANGINARTGPGTDTAQVDRFAGNCTLGFDGYCIGAPVADPISQTLDVRWLIVHRRHEYVSAAKILSQSAERKLGNSPAPRCSRDGGLPAPGTLSFTATPAGPTSATVTAGGRYIPLVGYGQRILDPVDGNYAYSWISINDKSPTFDGTWEASPSLPELSAGNGRIELAASACLGADVPYGAPQVYLATFVNGQLTTLVKSRPLSLSDSSELSRSACSGPD